MKLIGSYASPFVLKACIVLAEKGIDCEFVVDNPNDTGSRVGEFNPLGKVPVLVIDDGAANSDSSVIVEYVDAIFSGKTDSRARAATDPGQTLEALVDGLMEAAALRAGGAPASRSNGLRLRSRSAEIFR
jgi:glutathione S-transferase